MDFSSHRSSTGTILFLSLNRLLGIIMLSDMHAISRPILIHLFFNFNFPFHFRFRDCTGSRISVLVS